MNHKPKLMQSVTSDVDYQFGDIKVRFPKKAYDPQIKYMEYAINSLENSKNALLESPTGTGKTLALLCSSLGWLEFQKKNKKNKDSKIIFLCRTHSQIDNIVKELKQTSYTPALTILASRDRFCLKYKDKKNEGFSLRSACATAIAEQSCHYFRNIKQDSEKIHEELSGEILDIEECVNIAESCKVCPYYIQRDSLEAADLIIAPYSYVLNKDIRELVLTSKFSLKNKILIFDESHNVQQSAEEGASFEYTNKHFSICINELELLKQDIDMSMMKNRNNKLIELQIIRYFNKCMITMQKNLEKIFSYYTTESIQNKNVSLKYNGNKDKQAGFIKKGKFIIKVFKGIVNFRLMECSLRQITEIIMPNHLDKLCSSLRILLNAEQNFSSYRVLIYPFRDEPAIKFQCVDPALQFMEIYESKPRSIILTSGTLAPFSYFQAELGIPFYYLLENDHVIDSKKQTFVTVIDEGEKSNNFTFTHKGRRDINVLNDMGKILINICKNVPNGILACFASYDLMKKSLQYWEESKILNELQELKSIFQEPQNNSEACSKIVQLYKEATKNKDKGALFMGVCKGKVYEGIDFPNEQARAIVMIGIPIAYHLDPRFLAKLDFLKSILNFDSLKEWGKKEALLGVKQAIGRVIRHRWDYGAIFLCDERYKVEHKLISKWAKKNLKFISDFEKINFEIASLLERNTIDTISTQTSIEDDKYEEEDEADI